MNDSSKTQALNKTRPRRCPHCNKPSKISVLTALKTNYTCSACQTISRTKLAPSKLLLAIFAPGFLVNLTVGPTIRVLKGWGVPTYLPEVWIPLYLFWMTLIVWGILAMVAHFKTTEKLP
jgi:hypothetical protein